MGIETEADLGDLMYRGHTMAYWWAKGRVYDEAIILVRAELEAAGVRLAGRRSCADGVRELAGRRVL